MGKSQVPTHQGFNYFLTIVDDYTRITWIFLMVNKSKTFIKLRQFIIDVKNQHNTNIHTIRSNNGTEFTSTNFQNIVHLNGIHHQLTCTYTPQHNGRAERKHRYIPEMAKSLMIQSNIPLKFWGECVLTSCI